MIVVDYNKTNDTQLSFKNTGYQVLTSSISPHIRDSINESCLFITFDKVNNLINTAALEDTSKPVISDGYVFIDYDKTNDTQINGYCKKHDNSSGNIEVKEEITIIDKPVGVIFDKINDTQFNYYVDEDSLINPVIIDNRLISVEFNKTIDLQYHGNYGEGNYLNPVQSITKFVYSSKRDCSLLVTFDKKEDLVDTYYLQENELLKPKIRSNRLIIVKFDKTDDTQYHIGIKDRFMFKDEEGYKTVENGELILVSPTTPTEEEFKEKGLLDIPLDFIQNNEIPSNLVMRTGNQYAQVDLKFTSKPKTVLPKGDFSLKNKTLKQIRIYGNGDLRLLVSKNSGRKWYNTKEEVSLQDIATQGATISEISNMTEKDWESLLGIPDYLRVAYYLPDGSANSDKISLLLDFVGRWYSAEYSKGKYIYDEYSQLKVILTAEGDYKINYVNK